ncbi:MAG TPA: PQQ-binding-like beta-propeller repeat protein [Thermoguttaceae bacterium]|nr:PQQ-binding-like beta-propeller repeat protein [Thermoguttaceae bacterium]
MPQPDKSPPNDAYLAARVTAAIAAVFVAVICVLLAADFAHRQWKDPFDSPDFLALKSQLAAAPQDELLKNNLRALDHRLRREFFRRQRFATIGAHLLLLGVIVLVAADKTARVLRRRLPTPSPITPPSTANPRLAASRAAVRAVVLSGLTIAGLALWATLTVGTLLPTNHDQLAAVKKSPVEPRAASPSTAQEATSAPAWPSDDEIAAAWPRFRGPWGNAVSTDTAVPTTWDAATNKNILWKTPVPLPGNNSPIVWLDRVFLSGADRKRREVYCFDADIGKLLWTREAPSTPQSRAKPPKVEDATGYAAPTMTTDGRRAYAIFANGDVVALDFAGHVVWSRSLGVPQENMYGYAASLALHENHLFIQWDEATADDGLSKMIALDVLTGKTVWQVKRPVTGSWSSPLVARHAGRAMLITAADPWVIVYDPTDGRELWRAEGILGDHGVTPVVADNLLQVGNEYGEWLAIRLGGSGNVTETHIAWRGEDGLPDTVSPLVANGLLLLTTSSGVLTAYDAAKGEMLCDKDFETEITSSPTLIGRYVYLFAKDGRGFILDPSRDECKIISETNLAEPCVTSPAVHNNRLYLRTENHLFCIGTSNAQSK